MRLVMIYMETALRKEMMEKKKKKLKDLSLTFSAVGSGVKKGIGSVTQMQFISFVSVKIRECMS